MKKEDNWVNLTKLLCVLIVLLGHYNFTDWAGTNWLLYTVKSAVSVMFIYSGYYLCRNKILDEHEKTKEYLGHLGLMVIVWALLDFFNDVGNSGRTLDAVSEIFQDDMFNFVRLDYGHLWYIQNLFLAVAIMFIFKKKHFRVWEIILLIVLQKCYYWLLICSLASIGIGFILAESEKAFGKKRLITCLCTGVISAVILCGFSYEWFSIGGVCQEIIIETMRYVLAVSVAVVSLCMDSLVPFNLGMAGRYIRKLSTVIYLSHMMFVDFSFKVAAHNGALWAEKNFFIYSAGTAVIMSFTTGIVLVAVSGLKKFRWLRKIF